MKININDGHKIRICLVNQSGRKLHVVADLKVTPKGVVATFTSQNTCAVLKHDVEVSLDPDRIEGLIADGDAHFRYLAEIPSTAVHVP